MNERFAFDLDLAGRGTVAGADEAGRGCLAGPLVAAAVAFDYAALGDADFAALDGLNDSKKVSKVRRAALYDEILRRARQVVIVCCSAGTIDRVGLHRCNLGSLARAVEGIGPEPCVTLIDGFPLPRCRRTHRALVGGDSRSAAIAAASVVAKVTRDRLMLRLHVSHPQYGFDRHVGYATAAHHDAIVAYGVCELHRLSFASVAYRDLRLLVAGEEAVERG
ncbi:MAG: ribonuclease HII [Actinobacteria bacterium]|nr:ribonuclease HII [Actinomycetota bacterium]